MATNKAETLLKQNPLEFYLRTLLYMMMSLVIRAVAFLPLLALLLFPRGSPWHYGALLCPALLLFFLLPLRFSFADALVQPAGRRFFDFQKALSFRRYGEKLGESMLHTLSVFKWGIPLAGVVGYSLYLVIRGTDGFTIWNSIEDLGRAATQSWCRVVNFFRNLFGNHVTLALEGGLQQGFILLLVVLGLCLLLLYWGVMRNSASRYIWAYASHTGLKPRGEIRRRLRNLRIKQLLCAVVNLAAWTPFLYYLYRTYVSAQANFKIIQDVTTLGVYLIAGAAPDLSFVNAMIGPLLLGFCTLYIPFLPLRRYMTAYFAVKRPGGEHALPANGRSSGAPLPVSQEPMDAEPLSAPAPPPPAVLDEAQLTEDSCAGKSEETVPVPPNVEPVHPAELYADSSLTEESRQHKPRSSQQGGDSRSFTME